MNIADPSICGWDPAPFLFFSGNIWGDFIYYSHLFPALSILLIATFIFWHNSQNRAARALFGLSIVFSAWCLIDLILWASDRSDLIMFFWSILIYFDLLIYVFSLYFIYAFIDDRRPRLWQEGIIFALFIPLFLFSHTSLNLIGFDFTNCWREALEGPLWQYYVYNVELFIAIWIFIYGIRRAFSTKKRAERQKIFLVTGGMIFFLASFSLGNLLGSFGTNWEIGQYGLFGMPIFATLLAYLLIKYKAFDGKVLASEGLFAGSFILLLSLLFLQRIESVQTVTIVTLVLFSLLGWLLVRSIRAEVKQREQIEKLATRLERANLRLKEVDKLKSEFVSIASHQLRSPLTAIRGYASLLLEGSYGTIPEKAKEPLERISESSKLMASSIEDYLSISRIESGNMKYHLSNFNLRDQVESICDDLRPTALKKGIVILFRTDLHSGGEVYADLGKTQQIIHNLLNNALKYTPKGSVTVFVHDRKNNGRLMVEITDTGIGMSEDTLASLFQKFERAANSHEYHASGTGLGLYVAFRMAQAMGGTITAHSEGEGHGSRFVLELPLA